MKYTFFIMICLMLFSCTEKNKVPSGIIGAEKMKSILWDVMRAQALSVEIARKDSAVNEVAQTKVLNQKIFELHNITATDFDKSYAWYTNHPDVLKVILDTLSNQNQREIELKKKEKYMPKKLDSIKKLRKKNEQSLR